MRIFGFEIGRAKKPDVVKSFPSQYDGRLFSGGIGHLASDVEASKAYEYYNRNAPLAIVIDKIAEAIATVSPVLMNDKGIVKEHPALDFLYEPGFGQSYDELIREYATSLKLTGNAYLNIVGDVAGPPSSMHVVHPSNVYAYSDTLDGFVSYYNVILNGSQSVKYKRSEGGWRFTDGNFRELLHHRDVTTKSLSGTGRSPLNSIVYELDQRLAGSALNSAFLANGARPSGMLLFEDELSPGQLESVKSQLVQERTGYANAGKVFMFSGVKGEYKEMSISPRDMDYINLLKLTSDVVAARYNVPLPLVSIESMTFSNYSTAQLAFWTDCIIPTLNTIFSVLTRGILSRFRDSRGMWFSFDRLKIEALQDANIERARQMQLSNSFTDNEVRSQVGYPAYDGGDTIYKPVFIAPIGPNGRPLPPVAASPSQQPQTVQANAFSDEARMRFMQYARSANIEEERAAKIWNDHARTAG